MPTETYTSIASTALSSATSTVTFSSISSSYQDLILVMNFSLNDSGTTLDIRLNGDTANNYFTQMLQGTGSAAASVLSNGVAQMRLLGGDSVWANSGFVNQAVVNFLDYSATDKNKAILARSGTTGDYPGVRAIATRWASNSAINEISIFPGGGYSFQPGSTFNLFGVIA